MPRPWNRADAGAMVAFMLGLAITTSTALTSVVAAGVLGWAVLHARDCTRAWQTHRAQPIVLAMLALFAVVLTGVPQALVHGYEPWEILRKHALFMLVFFVGLALLGSSQRRNALLAGLSIGVALSLVLSMFSAATGISIVQTELEYADYHVFRDHAQHNTFLALTAFGVAVWLLRGARPRGWMIVGWCFVALAVFDIFFLVKGRTGQIAAIMLAIYAVVMALRRHRKAVVAPLIVVATAILIAGVVMAPSALREGIGQIRKDVELYRQGDSRSSVGWRLEFHLATLRLIAERPVMGYGTGAFAPAYDELVIRPNPSMEPTRNPHSDYLFYWMENGLAGLVAVIGLYLAIALSAWRTAGLRRAGYAAIVLTWASSSLANSMLLDRAWTFAIAALLAMLIAARSDTDV